MTELNMKYFISPNCNHNNEKYNILLQKFPDVFQIYVQKLDLNQFIEKINILNQHKEIHNYRVYIRKINVNKDNQIEFYILYQEGNNNNNNISLILKYNTNIIKNTNINSELKNEIFLLCEEFIKNFFSLLKNCTYLSELNYENIYFSTKTFSLQEINISRKDFIKSRTKFIKYIFYPFNNTIKKINIYDTIAAKNNVNPINYFVTTNHQLLNYILLKYLSDPNIINKEKYKKILNEYQLILEILTYLKFQNPVQVNILEKTKLKYDEKIPEQHYFVTYNCLYNMCKIKNYPTIEN